MTENLRDLYRDIREVNKLLAECDDSLHVDEYDFRLIDGFWTIDGMDPYDWAQALIGDEEE